MNIYGYFGSFDKSIFLILEYFAFDFFSLLKLMQILNWI